MPYYASAMHKHTHARILKPFEDSELMGLEVDIAGYKELMLIYLHIACQTTP